MRLMIFITEVWSGLCKLTTYQLNEFWSNSTRSYFFFFLAISLASKTYFARAEKRRGSLATRDPDADVFARAHVYCTRRKGGGGKYVWCICSALFRNLRFLQKALRFLGIPRKRAILQNGALSVESAPWDPRFLGICAF